MAYASSMVCESVQAGWFLESEKGAVVKTGQAAAALGVERGGRKIVPMGTILPANDATAAGILYEDADVSAGDEAVAVVVCGRVYADRLPEAPQAAAKSALEALGFTFIETSPAVTRPY